MKIVINKAILQLIKKCFMLKNTNSKKLDNQQVKDLFNALLSLERFQEAKMFLSDVLTTKEIQEISMRWKVARMLNKKFSYSKITKLTNMSPVTIAKINRRLKNGSGGYKLLLNR